MTSRSDGGGRTIGEDAEAAVERLAESACGGLRSEVAARRGDDARGRAVFERLQQAVLEPQRHGDDLVQEEGAALGCREPAARAGSGGRIAEQHRREARGGDRSARDLDEGPVRAPAPLVHPARDELASRPRRTGDEHTCVARGRQLDLLAEPTAGRAVDVELSAERVARVVAQAGDLPLEPGGTALQLRERAGGRERRGGVIGDGAKPREGGGVDARAGEDAEDPEHLAARRDERLRREAPDSLRRRPRRPDDPRRPLGHVVQQGGAAGRADLADLARAERDAMEVAVRPGPVVGRVAGPPGARDQVERLAVAADAAATGNVAQPEPGERDAVLTGGATCDRCRNARDRTLPGDRQQHPSQPLHPHDRGLS